MIAKNAYRRNLWFSIVFWVLAFLTALSNLLGFWTFWHLIGLAAAGYSMFPCFWGIGTFFSISEDEYPQQRKRYYRKNAIILAITLILALLNVFVFCTWGMGAIFYTE